MLSDADFRSEFQKLGAAGLARKYGISQRGIYARRARLEGIYGEQIKGNPAQDKRSTRRAEQHAARLQFDIENGVVLVGSDAHIWPGALTTAMRAFIKFCRELKPSIVVMNGDVMDHPTISRHAPIGWESRPTVEAELKAAQEQLAQVRDASSRAKLVWSLGNHDARFETRLATVAPEYARIHGFHLKDHFPDWSACWSVWVNDSTVIKHRFKSGIHATHNATLWAGKTIVTGHLHSLKVTPFSDYAEHPRYGVDTGTLADPYGPQFLDYTEDNPRNHRSGFVVLTFHRGVLLWPEIVHVFDQKRVQFRGSLYEV